MSTPRGEASDWVAIVAACAVTAATIDLGTVHRLHQADSLLPALVSLQHWQPFYWGQDRLGMLLPLLALPFADPFANVLVQSGLAIFAALMSFFLIARFARVPQHWLCGLVAVGSFLVFCPAPLRFEYLFGHQPYGVSLTLGLAGLVSCEDPRRGRVVAGAAMVALAHWVNVTVWLILLPALVLRAAFGRAPQPVVRDAGIVLVGAGIGRLLMMLASAHGGPRGLLAPSSWPEAWQALAAHAWDESGAWLPASALLGCVGAIAGRAAGQGIRSEVLCGAGILVGCAMAYGLAVGTIEWVALNAFSVRYVLPSLVFATTGLAALGVELVAARPAASAGVTRYVVVPSALLAIAIWAYGPPSLRGARTDLWRVGSYDGWTENLLAAGCTHVSGNYWRVWPAVFHAAVITHERGEDRTLWGLTERAQGARRRWRHLPIDRFRVCVAPDDPEVGRWLARFRLRKLVAVSEMPGMRIFAAPPPDGTSARPHAS
jgi:hypothetical protein